MLSGCTYDPSLHDQESSQPSLTIVVVKAKVGRVTCESRHFVIAIPVLLLTRPCLQSAVEAVPISFGKSTRLHLHQSLKHINTSCSSLEEHISTHLIKDHRIFFIISLNPL
jgi:hypothetical protein